MEHWIGDLLVDFFPPEKSKFKASLVLVHGLWTGSWCWRSWATHFSNLGWECHALNFRGRFEEKPLQTLKRLTFDDCVQDLAKVLRSFSFPPILVAHSMGSLIAAKAAEQNNLSALVFVAPVVPKDVNPRRRRLLRLKYIPLIYLGRPFLIDEKDFRDCFTKSLPHSTHSAIFRRAVPESPRLVREFFNVHAEVRPDGVACPTIVLAGANDAVVPVRTSRELASRLGAEFESYPQQGHWMIENGESIVRDVHRWVVRRLGDQILLADLT